MITVGLRRRADRPSRSPHPDPRVEAELQRIISLRRSAARKEGLLDESYARVRYMRSQAAKNPGAHGTDFQLDLAEDLLEEAEEVEAEIRKLHEEIAAAIAALDDSDVAYLT